MNVTIIAVPYEGDVGRWGAATGPAALLDAGLDEVVRELGHATAKLVTIELPREERTRDTITNLARIGARVSAAVAESLRDPDGFPLVLEGNCVHAVGAAGGLRAAGSRPGIVWYDAHGDLHTYATTETGFIGGMPFAVCLGWDLDDWRDACALTPAVPATAAALIGGSDLDRAETDAITAHGVGRLDADELDDDGTATRLLLDSRRDSADSWYLHLDVDVVGAAVPGAGTPTDAPAPTERVLASLRAAVATVPITAAAVATYSAQDDPDRAGVPFIFDCVRALLGGGRPSNLSSAR